MAYQPLNQLPIDWVERIFERLAALYGSQFASKWGAVDTEKVKVVWAETLGEFDGEAIRAALIECGKTCKHPPSAPEFYQLCKAFKGEPCHRNALPKLYKKNPAITELGLKSIKAIFEQSKLTNGSNNKQ